MSSDYLKKLDLVRAIAYIMTYNNMNNEFLFEELCREIHHSQWMLTICIVMHHNVRNGMHQISSRNLNIFIYLFGKLWSSKHYLYIILTIILFYCRIRFIWILYNWWNKIITFSTICEWVYKPWLVVWKI